MNYVPSGMQMSLLHVTSAAVFEPQGKSPSSSPTAMAEALQVLETHVEVVLPPLALPVASPSKSLTYE
jgi:hypothetical protein